MKKGNLSTCCGGLGACVCTLSMLLPVIIGSAGAGTSVMGSMSGMARRGTGFLILFNAINFIGPPVLVLSVALILYGMRNFGRIPVTLAAFGGSLLYLSMYVMSMSIPIIALSFVILTVSYVVAYRPFFRRTRFIKIQ